MPQIDLGQVVGAQGPQGIQGPQGAQGIQGPAGPAATINGVNALTIEAGANIDLAQEGGTATLSVPTDSTPTADSTKPVQSGGVLAALANKANRNLLDNWYFVGGGMTGKFPVNQRGLSSYGPTTANYNSIDRWLVNSGTMSPETDGLNLTGPGIIIQRFENLDLSDGEYVFSCLTAGGCFSAPLTDHYVACGPFNVTRDTSTDNLYVFFQSTTSVKLKAVKLERGTTQTLAHQDEDGNWVLNEIPDYGAELAKCQRYLIPMDANSCWGFAESNTSAYLYLPLPVSMRTTPVFQGNLPPTLWPSGNSVTSISVFSPSAIESMIALHVVGTGFIAQNCYSLNQPIGFLSAEL